MKALQAEAGEPAPGFDLPTGDGKRISLESLRGRIVVLYFYPKDMTSGCTTEACDFRDREAEMAKEGAVVLGVSPDTAESHGKFAAKHALGFPLLADVDHAAQLAYGVRKPKKMYGRSFIGVERSTFLIDETGVIRRVWRKVRVAGHAEEVLEEVRRIGAEPRTRR